MKKSKLFFGAIALMFAVSSCTADYECKCESKTTILGQTFTTTDEFEVEGATRFQAQAACNEATIKDVDSNGNTTSETTCELNKK